MPASLSKKEINKFIDLLPQKFPMKLLTGIHFCDKKNGVLRAIIDTSKNNIFYEIKNNGIPSIFSIEYIAQTAGLFCCILDPTNRDKLDLLIEVKNFKTYKPYLFSNEKYYAEIQLKNKIEEIARFFGVIYNHSLQRITEMSLKIYRSHYTNISQ